MGADWHTRQQEVAGVKHRAVVPRQVSHLEPGRDYRHLPEPIRLEDTVATTDTEPVPDPDGGRDPHRDFMLRNAML